MLAKNLKELSFSCDGAHRSGSVVGMAMASNYMLTRTRMLAPCPRSISFDRLCLRTVQAIYPLNARRSFNRSFGGNIRRSRHPCR